MRWLLVLALPALTWACATATAIDVSVDSEVGCEAGAAAVIIGGTDLAGLAASSPSTVSTACLAPDGGEAELGNVVLVPVASESENVAFAVMTRPDGQPADGCLSPSESAQCIVAKRELRFIPKTDLGLHVDLRLSCLGVACPAADTCVKGACVPAEVPSNCPAPCDEGALLAGAPMVTIGGTVSGLAPGDSVTLANNSGAPLTVGANGAFTFPTAIGVTLPYDVTVVANPTSPTAQTCAVTSGAGTARANVTSVQITCATNGLVGLSLPTAGNYYSIAGLTVGNGSVYWTNNHDPGSVMSVPTAGGTTAILTSGENSARAIAATATSVYFTTEVAVKRVPIGGGTATTLASDTAPQGIAVDGTNVYWTDTSGTVQRMPLAGGTAITLASGQSNPVGIAVAASGVYWVNQSDPGTVMSVPPDGGAPTTLVSGQNKPYRIAVDAARAYWTNSGGGTVMSVPLGGGAPTLLASGQDGPYGIVVDSASVYWTNSGGGVLRVPIAGGAVSTLAPGPGPGEIGLDATSLYWGDNGGSVVRLTPK